ncbi:MAG: hypothetical protein AAB618_02500 [Patescibacteria group bacterium]
MNYPKTFTLLAILVVLAPSAAFASSVVRTGETISIEKDQKIEGDFYAASSVLSISGEVAEDLISVAGRNTLNGTVGKDAFMLGASVDVHGAVGEDLRIIAGDVIIAEPVTGDVFIIADTVKILSTASIGGDLVVYGGTVEVSGSVGGNVLGNYQSLRLDAPVAKGVDVTAEQFVLGERAEVTENVRYVSLAQLTRAQSAKVGGEVTRSDNVTDSEGKTLPRHIMIVGLVLLFSVLAWFLVARSLMVKMVERALVRGVRPVLLGFITLIAAPVVFVVLTVSIIGTVVGITGILFYLALMIVTLVGMSATLGTLLSSLVLKTKEFSTTPYSLIAGVAGIIVLVFIPILGPILLFVLFLITLGALVDMVLRHELAK